MIPLLSNGDSITHEQINAVADALDTALAALFQGQSPLLYLPLSGSPSWRESGLAGQMFVFGTQSDRRILAAVASHNQAAVDALVIPGNIRSGINRVDDELRQVTLDLPSDALDRSLVAHRLTFTDGPDTRENYWCRMLVLSAGETEYFWHQKPLELEVADVVFEGHSERLFHFKAEWTKFQCIRFHNLDPHPVPLTILFDGTETQVALPRWGCITMRRTEDGLSWENQGFLLFPARESDLDRFGGTMPWNDKVGAGGLPWFFLRHADAANNVASFASVWRWLDYFSRGITPEVLGTVGEGVQGANDERTGIWYEHDVAFPDAAAPSNLSNPNDPESLVWRLAMHGGRFIVAKKFAGEPEHVCEMHSASIEELIAGGHPSGLKVSYELDELRLKIQDTTDLDYVDFIPVTANFAGFVPISIPADASGVACPRLAPVSTPIFFRLSGSEVRESAIGISNTQLATHEALGIEESDDGAPISQLPTTVGDLSPVTFEDGTRDNDHTFFEATGTRWDGRHFLGWAQATVVPQSGSLCAFAVVNDLLGRPVYPGDNSLFWTQASHCHTYPARGGVWHLPDRARRAWPPRAPDIRHPHTFDNFGTAEGGDWRAEATGKAPKSQVEMMQATPPALTYDFSCAGHTDIDSLVHLSSRALDPIWWGQHRDAALAGQVLPDETRPVVGVGLHSTHYNLLAARLNAIEEVIPFSFFDAQWYGTPFAPTHNGEGSGIYGGHIYPGDHLKTFVAGSVTQARAIALGVPIKSFSSQFPHIVALQSVSIEGRFVGLATQPLLDDVNLLNDLLIWFRPDRTISYGNIIRTTPPLFGDWEFTSTWVNVWKTTNPEAVVPDIRWVTVNAVRFLAQSLGIPFRLERLGFPLKVKTFLATGEGAGARGYFPTLNFGRTEAMLVIDHSDSPELIAFSQRTSQNSLQWAPDGTVRLANWPVCPQARYVASEDPECAEMICSLQSGYNRLPLTLTAGPVISPFAVLVSGTSPSHGISSVVDLFDLWRNGSPFTTEAPRVVIQAIADGVYVPAGWIGRTSRLMALPVAAVQWGETDLVSNPPPDVEPRFLSTADLPDQITPQNLGAELNKGGFQIALWPSCVMP